jgi:hypothetical protein
LSIPFRLLLPSMAIASRSFRDLAATLKQLQYKRLREPGQDFPRHPPPRRRLRLCGDGPDGDSPPPTAFGAESNVLEGAVYESRRPDRTIRRETSA